MEELMGYPYCEGESEAFVHTSQAVICWTRSVHPPQLLSVSRQATCRVLGACLYHQVLHDEVRNEFPDLFLT